MFKTDHQTNLPAKYFTTTTFPRSNHLPIFTREYTQCTAGYTFCFVVGVGVGVGVVATFNRTWQYFS
jgi:hypothetical protein